MNNVNTIPTSEYRTNNKFMPSLNNMTALIEAFAFKLAEIRNRRFALLKELGIEAGSDLAREVDNDIWHINHTLVLLGVGDIKRRTGIRKVVENLVKYQVLSTKELAEINALLG